MDRGLLSTAFESFFKDCSAARRDEMSLKTTTEPFIWPSLLIGVQMY
jgi:hypothetical protein